MHFYSFYTISFSQLWILDSPFIRFIFTFFIICFFLLICLFLFLEGLLFLCLFSWVLWNLIFWLFYWIFIRRWFGFLNTFEFVNNKMTVNDRRFGNFLILIFRELLNLNGLLFISLFIFGLIWIFHIARRFCILPGYLDVVKNVGVVFLNFVESHLSIVELEIFLVFDGSFFKCIMDLSQAQKHHN